MGNSKPSTNRNQIQPPPGVRVKFILLRHYWWVLGAALTGFVIYGLFWGLDLDVLLPILAAILSALYFLQKQKLEELKTFREIFEACNKRYDKLNDALDKIYSVSEGSLSEDERHLLGDYFNLCAEEYLYFSRGYIYPEVWDAWYNGMKFYLKNPRIMGFWSQESSTNSHYGLHF